MDKWIKNTHNNNASLKHEVSKATLTPFYLMILLQDVVHLSHVFARDDLDDVLLVVGGVKASAAAALGVARNRRTSRQRVLQDDRCVAHDTH